MNTLAWRLHDLTADKVNEVIADVERQDVHGDTIVYAVDTHEVFDYCFPIKPTRRHTKVNSDSIADDQIALYHVFNQYRPLPLLLEEYRTEVRAIFNYVERVMKSYNNLAVIDSLIRESGMERFLQKENQPLLDLVSNDFNILLTVLMGIHSLGIERLNDVLFRLSEPPVGVVSVILDSVARDYRPSRLCDVIYEELVSTIPDGSDEFQANISRQTAVVDSQAIDRLLFTNRRAAELYSAGQIDRRQIFLYLSSAGRTGKVFSHPEVIERLPKIDGAAYPVWRTRSQIFVRVVHQSANALRRLREVILEEPNKMLEFKLGNALSASNICRRCILNGGHDEICQFGSFCRQVAGLKNQIATRRVEMSNLRLMKSILEYKDLLSIHDAGKYTRWVEVFARIVQDRELGDFALQKVRDIQFVTIAQSQFARIVPDIITAEYGDCLRAGRDAVTGSIQYLPIRLQLASHDYDEILEQAIEFYKTPVKQMLGRLQQIVGVIDRYMMIDQSVDKFSPDHELVRCFLYLSHLKAEGDEQAYAHAKAMRDSHLDASQFGHECDYVMCWASRRRRRYEESYEIATKSIGFYPEDARFYHGRALAAFAYLCDVSRQPSEYMSLSGVIDDLSEAVRLYPNGGERDRELVGACLNGLAYCLAFDRCWAGFNLPKARERLEELKLTIPKSSWNPAYPEYLHTEAWIEYEEFEERAAKGVDLKPLESKLRSALQDVITAFELYPKEIYKQLMKRLAEALERIEA